MATAKKDEKEQPKKGAAGKKEEEKKDKFQEAIDLLEKDFGKGTIISGKDVKSELEVIPTGSLNLDLATNIGGWPLGCLIELYGPESSGKSTLMLHAMGNFQKKFKNPEKNKIVFINPEHAFDRVYATALGVDVDNLVINQPDSMEDMYEIIERLVRTGMVRLIVVDSHTAALPKDMIAKPVGEATMALQARFNSTGLGKIKPLLKPNRCTLIGISQLRTAIGSYGNPDKPTGGNAWKFYSDMRLRVYRQVDKDNKEMAKTWVEIPKSKVACPFGIAKFVIGGGKGIDRKQEIIDLAVEFNFIQYTAKGGWYTVGSDGTEGSGTKLQGANAMKAFLADNEAFADKLESDVLLQIKLNGGE